MSRKMIDVDTLIQKVYLRSAIWDKHLKEHANRTVVDHLWSKIAKEMDMDEARLRKKWKYLRDQFSAEYSKAASSSVKGKTSSARPFVPRWPYYEPLSFLKSVVKPRLTTKSPHISQRHTETAAIISKIDSAEFQSLENESRNDDTSDNYFEDGSKDGEGPSAARRRTVFEKSPVIHLEGSDGDDEDDEEIEEHFSERQDTPQKKTKKRKRVERNAKLIETMLEMEKSRLETEDCDDLLFFRSLLSHVRKIPDNQKLRFRSRINEVVQEFAYPSGS